MVWITILKSADYSLNYRLRFSAGIFGIFYHHVPLLTEILSSIIKLKVMKLTTHHLLVPRSNIEKLHVTTVGCLNTGIFLSVILYVNKRNIKISDDGVTRCM